MRQVALLLPLALLLGCPKNRDADSIVRKEEAPTTRLGCPAGTYELGQVPPEGLELWCARLDETGRQVRHGPSRSWWPDGRPQSYGAFANDQKVGHWWFWTADGHLEREGAFRDDRENGYWLVYRTDGTVAAEGPMADGGRDGVWVTYDESTGLAQDGLWSAGEKDGVWVEYNTEGRPQRERVFRRGRLISQREL